MLLPIINYRLANGGTIIHEQIKEDIDAAIGFLASKTADYSISENMALVGASAGGHLSLLYAYKYDTENRIKAVANVFGVSYFADWDFYNSFNLFLGGNVKDIYIKYVGEPWNTNLYQSLSPYHLVSATQYKPTITFHGDTDVIVPVYQSQWFKAKLESLNLNNAYYQYPGQGHGFSDQYNNDMIDKIVPFFKSNM